MQSRISLTAVMLSYLNLLYFSIILSGLLTTSLAVSNGDFFRAAVIEYNSESIASDSEKTVRLNVLSYGNIVNTLKARYNDLSIVVFPEMGLTSLEWISKQNASLLYTVTLPEKNESFSLCNEKSNEVVSSLACIAKSSEVYLVVNWIDKALKNSTDVWYNTNIVFSPIGSLIAKYHKYNLFGIENNMFTKPEIPEIIFFDTNFGVRFGVFTCIDIVYKSPALDFVNGNYGVSHIVYNNAWVNELPYLSAIETHSGWSYGTNKILLSSGLNNPELGSSGTGFYFGKITDKSSNFPTAIQNQIKGTFAIISNVPKFLNITSFDSETDIYYRYNTTNPHKVSLKVHKDNMNIYKTQKIITNSSEATPVHDWPTPTMWNLTLSTKTLVNQTLCDHGFCCDFVFNLTKYYCLELITPSKDNMVGEEFGQFNYRLAVFNGTKVYDGINSEGVQLCSIISCINDTEGSCGDRTDKSSPDYITAYSMYKYYACGTTFDNLTIKAKNFNTENGSFITTNSLLSSGEYAQSVVGKDNLVNFGKVLRYNQYKITSDQNNTYMFSSQSAIENPATISLYNRVFSWDGLYINNTDDNTSNKSPKYEISGILLIIMFVINFKLIV